MSDDGLEALFAAQDAAIRDDGFSERVMRSAERMRLIRRLTLWGGSLAGGLVAGASLTPLMSALGGFDSWLGKMTHQVDAAVQTRNLALSAPDLTSGPLLLLSVVVVGLSICLVGLVLQER